MVSFSDSYADEDKSGIRVAQYLTELPSKEVLLRQLQKSLEAARENMPIENEKTIIKITGYIHSIYKVWWDT